MYDGFWVPLLTLHLLIFLDLLAYHLGYLVYYLISYTGYYFIPVSITQAFVSQLCILSGLTEVVLTKVQINSLLY